MSRRLLFGALLLALFAASAAWGSGLGVSAQEEELECEVGAYDVNQDGYLSFDDIWVWESFIDRAEPDARADLNGDGKIEKADILGFDELYNSRGCQKLEISRPPTRRGIRPGDDGPGAGAGASFLGGSQAVSPDATGGPDNFGYTYKDSAEAGCGVNFESIVNDGVSQNLGLGDDNGVVVPLGFNFSFYGTDQTSVGVASNGYLTFGATLTDFTNDCPVPSGIAPNDMIAGIWDDLTPNAANNVHAGSYAAGDCPGGRAGACFVAEWDGVQHFGGTGSNTFQIILHEDGVAEVQIQEANEAGAQSTTALENASGTDGLAYGCSDGYLGSLPVAVYFLPPGRTACVLATDDGISVDPNRQLGKQVHLPILNFQGQDDVCRTWIEVQYIGCDPSKAVLVTWGEPGFCPPQAAGPLKVECTGLLNPGSTWNLLGAQIPTGSKSGILFKFTAQQLSDVGLDDDLGFDDVVADLMCETLFFGVVGDSDDYRRFKKAYNEGLDFAGINQRIASGDGILAVEVLRHCPGDVTPGVEVSSRYNGIAGTHLGIYDPIFGGHGYYVPLIYAEKAGLNTVMYIQNGGLQCSSVEIWFKAQDDCLRARICEIFTLAPGESYQWDASDCVGPDWQGSAWLRSSQVLGIAVDIFGRDVLMTYIGEPQPYDYVVGFEEDGSPIFETTPTTGEKVAYGPLMYSEYQGWDTGVQVQNLSEVVNAKVKVYFLDRSGDVITTLVDWICPRGSQTFFLPVVADLPGSWVGSIRIESQDWWTPGTNPIGAPYIVGVAQLMKYSDVARTDTQEAIAYNLLPEHKSYIWQIGSGQGGLNSGVGLIAIPSLLKDLDNTGTTSEIAIMNLVTKPGFTDFAIYIYDQNGLLDFVCQKLHDRQVEYIDLQTWGYVNNGFKGSAIISATFWEHEVFVDPRTLEDPAQAEPVQVSYAQTEAVDCGPLDLTQDGKVDQSDVVAWQKSYDLGNIDADLNADGLIEAIDGKMIVAAAEGPACGGETPASLDLTGGPNAFGYLFADSNEAGVGHTFTEISGSGSFIGSADDSVFAVNLQEPFNYYGVDYTQLFASTNGFVSTSSSTSDLSNSCPYPDASHSGAIMGVLHDDLDTANSIGGIYTEYFSTCPRAADVGATGSCTIVMWDEVEEFSSSAPWDMEVYLYHETGEFVMAYDGRITTTFADDATIGIQDLAQGDPLTYQCDTAIDLADTSIRWGLPIEGGDGGGGGIGSGFVRNLVGLGAVSIERTGTRLNEDVPGDEAAGSRGIPFAGEQGEDICLGGGLPVCPGQP